MLTHEHSVGMPAVGVRLYLRSGDAPLPIPLGRIHMIHRTIAPLLGASMLVPVFSLTGNGAVASAAEIVTELPPVTSSAHAGADIPHDNTGVSVDILDIPLLKEEGVYNLSDAVTSSPGVFCLPGGGINQRGNSSNITIRGISSASQTLCAMDGMRLSGNAGSGGGNVTPNILARTTLHDIGNVEILKGSQGAVYGGGAIGGVIWMETPKGDGLPSISLFNEVGSFDSYTGNLTTQGQEGALSWFLSATYEHTDNDLTTASGAKPTSPHAGKYQNHAEALRLDYDFNESNSLTLTYRREDSSYHLADLSPYGETPMLYTFRSNLLTAKFQSKINEQFNSSLMLGYYGSDIMYGRGDTYQDIRNVQVEWRNRYRWCEHQSTIGGFSWNRDDFTNDSIWAPGSNTDRNLQNTYGFFAEHHVTPNKHWDNSLALRWDSSNNFDHLFSARVASSWRFNEERTRLYGSAGRGYRAPNSFQSIEGASYSNGYGTYFGNSHLDCETSWSADVGVEHEFVRHHSFSISLFHIRTEDAIVATPLGHGDYLYTNSSTHQTAQGVEMSLKGCFVEAWNAEYSLSCTLTRPKTAHDLQIANSARQIWAADVRITPTDGLTTGIGLTAVNGRSDYTNGSRLDSYYTLRWYANYKVNEHLTLHLRVENLTNQKFVTSENWYGSEYSLINPGTAVYGGCTIQF